MAEYRLRHLFTHIIAGAVGAGIVLGAQSLMQPKITDNGTDTEDEFGTSVRDYLNQNPDVVVDAIRKYQANEEQKQVIATKQFIKDSHAALYNDPASPVVGNPNGDVTLVEFFDYNCHYCRGAAPDVAKLIADDPKLRVVHKQLPILGPSSIEAAKVVLAAYKQSPAIYVAMNKALWEHQGILTDADIEKIARASGAKWDQILVDKESDAVKKQITDDYELAQKLGLSGTPGFIIGDNLYPGVQSYDQMKNAVTQVRVAANAKPSGSAASAAPAPPQPSATPTRTAAPEMPTPAPTTTQVSEPPTDKTASPAAPPAPAAK